MVLIVDMGYAPLKVELYFQSIRKFDFVATTHFFTFDDELFGVTLNNVAGNVARHQRDRKAIGTFHFFPNAFGIELNHGAITQQYFVFFTINKGLVNDT